MLSPLSRNVPIFCIYHTKCTPCSNSTFKTFYIYKAKSGELLPKTMPTNMLDIVRHMLNFGGR